MARGIIADPDVLEEEYIPQDLPCREAQKSELTFCLSPIEKRMKPFDCLCHGKPGTGKTALVKYVLQQVNENTGASGFYVNCWENRTINQVLDRLLRQVGIPVVEANYSVKFSKLKKAFGKKVQVIALDEVDKLEKKGLNDVLYMLNKLGKIGLVCISNTRKYILNIDSRIISRLNVRSISFFPYSDEELKTILRQRIVDCRALYPDTCRSEILQRIVDFSAGDARVAIQLLKSAAQVAEGSNRHRISVKDIERGYEEVKEIKKKYRLDNLSPHHKLIVEIVKNNPGILSSHFYSTYRKESRRLGLSPKSSRTFSNYISELIELGFLKVDRANVRGNVRSFNAK